MGPLWLAGVLVVLTLFVFAVLLFRKMALLAYVAGETEEEALRMIVALHRAGYGVVSDILGEAVNDAESAKKAADTYGDHLLQLYALNNRYPNMRLAISVKLSQLGLQFDQEKAGRHAIEIFQCARECTIGFQIDMEGPDLIDAIMTVVHELSKIDTGFYLAISANYARSLAVLYECAHYYGIRGVRIVKGAYKGSITQQKHIDENYLRIVAKAKECGLEVILGTHDEKLECRARELCPDAELHMLLGVRPYARKDGIYMPWGSERKKYFARRLKEGIRPRVLFLFVRNIWKARRWRKELEQCL